MNERIFNESIASKSVSEPQGDMVQDAGQHQTVVHKFSFEHDPIEMARNGFYMSHAKALKLARQNNQESMRQTYECCNFKGRSDIKPIKWIGTQRSAFTHRVKQKRIKDLIQKEKENR